MSSVIERKFTSYVDWGSNYDYIREIPYTFFLGDGFIENGQYIENNKTFKFGLYGLFTFYQDREVNTYYSSQLINPPNYAIDPGPLMYTVRKYVSALYFLFVAQEPSLKIQVELFGNQNIQEWIDFIESLDLPMVRVIEDPDDIYYEMPLLLQTAAYWAWRLNGMNKTFNASFYNLKYFWKIISNDDPYWGLPSWKYPNWPQYDDAEYGTYLNSGSAYDDLRIWVNETIEENVKFFQSLLPIDSPNYKLYSKKYESNYYYSDGFLGLSNRTSYIWLYKHTQVEPFNFDKTPDQRTIFSEYVWEEPFVDKNFYVVIQIRSNGSGGLETVLTKKYKNNFVDTNTDPNLDPNLDPNVNSNIDLNSIKPIYGSNVSFSSRLNYLQTSNNSLKLLPSSENNLVTKFNFKYLLKNNELSFLLKKIENAEGYKNLEFSDPSSMYKNVIGVVEGYNINKLNNNINELDISISSYFKAPIFNWKTSSFLTLPESLEYSSSKNYKKYEFVYFDPKTYDSELDGEKNKSDNFWFAKEDIIASNNQKFDTSKWTKTFNHDLKLPFNLSNKYDFYQLDYKNSFIQNIKYKENSNALKKFEIKIENISDIQCRSILFFFEKKGGYRRFIYKFPFIFSGYLAFVCTDWNHTFKYQNCHDISATFVQDVSINSLSFKFIDYDFYTLGKIVNPYPKLLASL